MSEAALYPVPDVAVLTDEELVQLAVEAQEWAEEAEGEAGSEPRWKMADSFLALRERSWSLKSIGHAVGMSTTNVHYYVQTAKTFHLGENRPTFSFAYREVKGEKLDALHDSQTDEWETPQGLFDLLNDEFGFDLDVCADEHNAKCGRYFSKDEDGLERPWEGVCWMNPPYSGIDKWMRKAFESAQAGATVVCLVPARTDTAWWWDTARFGEIRFLRGRLKFGGAKAGAPFPSAVVVFPREPVVVWWER